MPRDENSDDANLIGSSRFACAFKKIVAPSKKRPTWRRSDKSSAISSHRWLAQVWFGLVRREAARAHTVRARRSDEAKSCEERKAAAAAATAKNLPRGEFDAQQVVVNSPLLSSF